MFGFRKFSQARDHKDGSSVVCFKMETQPTFDSLPDNLILDILNYLPVKDLCLSGRVCRRWRRIARDNSLWKCVDLSPYRLDLRKMWKVIRSHFSECLHTLKLRGGLDNVRDKNPISDAMLADLNERCPNIKYLSLYLCKLQDIQMKFPSSLTSVEINHCSWKPRWFENVHIQLPNLRKLSLEHTTRVDNHDMGDISKITNLEVLNLNGCYRINERGLEQITTKLFNLRTLEIAYCGCTDLILHHIARHLPKIEVLNLRYSLMITDSGVSTVVVGLSKLKHLNINLNTQLTTSSVECLKTVKSLKSLVCDPSHITTELERELESKGCDVTVLKDHLLQNVQAPL